MIHSQRERESEGPMKGNAVTKRKRGEMDTEREIGERGERGGERERETQREKERERKRERVNDGRGTINPMPVSSPAQQGRF